MIRFVVIVSLVWSSCSVNVSFRNSDYSPEPGSLLREAAGRPASVSEELLITSRYIGQVEDVIASCMRSSGFEYVSQQTTGVEQFGILGLDLDPDAYAKRYGFGIANGAIQGIKVQSDQQTEYLTSLSPEEYLAYRVALEGDGALKEPGTEVLEIGGCTREALDSVDQPTWSAHSEWLDAVSVELSQRLSSDSRLIEIEEQWVQCMADSGYGGLISVEQLSISLSDEFSQLFQVLIPTQDFRNGDEFLDALDDESRSAFEEFRSREIELAVASHECSKDHDATVASISEEIERSILASNPLPEPSP